MRTRRNSSRTSNLKAWIFPSSLLLTIVACATASAAQATPSIDLSPEERKWLSEHPTITLVAAAENPPAIMLSPEGKLVGMVPDLYAHLSRLR